MLCTLERENPKTNKQTNDGDAAAAKWIKSKVQRLKFNVRMSCRWRETSPHCLDS